MTGLGERLEGAVYDSDEIWEVRHPWRRCLDELETRFAAIEAMLARQSPRQEPGVVDLRLDREQLRARSHFQRAAVRLAFCSCLSYWVRSLRAACTCS